MSRVGSFNRGPGGGSTQSNPFSQWYSNFNTPYQGSQTSAENANRYMSVFNMGNTGLTPEQQAALASQGINTGAGDIAKWQQSLGEAGGFKWDTQVPIASQIANQGRFQAALGLNTLQGQQAQSQLNETGAFMASNRNARFGELTAADAGYSQGMGEVMKSYDTARNELDMAGQGAITGLLARERQQVAGAQQGLQSRGLGNTTIVDNARRGISADTGTAIAGVQEQVGGMRSQVAQNRAGAQQSMYGTQADMRQKAVMQRNMIDSGMSDFMKSRTQYENGILGDRINLIQSMNDQAKGNAPAANSVKPDNTGAYVSAGASIASAAIIAAALI